MEIPWDKLIRLATERLVQEFPTKHNELLSGRYQHECEIFALDAMLHNKIGGVWIRWLDPDEQEKIIGGVEELLFEELPKAEIIPTAPPYFLTHRKPVCRQRKKPE